GDRILEVDDDGVGFDVRGLGQFLFAVPGDEQHRAQQHGHLGLRRMRAERLHWPTSSSRWLKQRWVKMTMPLSGRDLLSRSSSTSVSMRMVSPWNRGLGKRTSSQPRLATAVPRVVSPTEIPTMKARVRQLLTMRAPYSVCFEASSSRWRAAGLWVRAEKN